MLSCLASPFTVNLLFSIEAQYPNLMAVFDASVLLTYFGSILSGVGIILLGLLNLYQNRQIQVKNEEIQVMRDRWEKENTKRPFFYIESFVGTRDQKAKSLKTVISCMRARKASRTLQFAPS